VPDKWYTSRGIQARIRARKLYAYALGIIRLWSSLQVVSIRVPKDLKDEMGKVDMDWSDYLRRSIEERVKVERMRRACMTMDELREKTKGVKFDSVKVIREARDSR